MIMAVPISASAYARNKINGGYGALATPWSAQVGKEYEKRNHLFQKVSGQRLYGNDGAAERTP